MLKSHRVKIRPSFTLVELVVSIVVIGIATLSIPIIVKETSLNTIESQNIIAYYNALALMDTIRSKPWDRNNVEDYSKSGEYYILNTKDGLTGCTKREGALSFYSKPGLSGGDKRRMCDQGAKEASVIKKDNKLESINDFDGYEATIRDYDNKNDRFKLDVSVNYARMLRSFNDNNCASGTVNDCTNTFQNDLSKNTTSSFKKIDVNVYRVLDGTKGKDPIAVFTYYAANIGTDTPYTKDNN